MPRAMTVFAHPDDETIALGARLGRLQRAHLVQVTDGAPADAQDSQAHGFASLAAYRAARAEELEHALLSAGLEHISRECLGVPDQQASLSLVSLSRALFERLQQHRPEVLFTHPYEGGHPDHDACAFAVHQAVRMFRRLHGAAPLIVEAAFYHAGPEGIETGSFLPEPPVQEGAGVPAQPLHETAVPLTPEEQIRKRQLLECFRTQQDTLQYFSVSGERFRIAPPYDFSRPPHAAPVFYDQYPWGMRSLRFGELARSAEEALQGDVRASVPQSVPQQAMASLWP